MSQNKENNEIIETELTPIAEDHTPNSEPTQSNPQQIPQLPTFKEAEELLEEGINESVKNNIDEAIEKCSRALEMATQIKKSDMDYDLVKFYYNYGDILLSKIIENPNLFGEEVQKYIKNEAKEIKGDIQNEPTPLKDHTQTPQDQLPTPENKEEPINEDKPQQEQKEVQNKEEQKETENRQHQKEAHNKEEKKESEEEKVPQVKNEEEEEDEDDDDEEDDNEEEKEEQKEEEKEAINDLQLVWEILDTARVIVENKLNSLKGEKEPLNEIEASQNLAKIHMRLGDTLIQTEDYENAINEYTKALELRKYTEEESSRDLAESFYSLGNLFLSQGIGKEREGVKYLHESRLILLKNLGKMMNKPDLSLPQTEEDINKEVLKINENDDNEVQNLKEVISALYDKIEDALIQDNENPELRKELQNFGEEISNNANESNTFDQPKLSTSEVKDLGCLKGSVTNKKRNRSDLEKENNNSELNEILAQDIVKSPKSEQKVTQMENGHSIKKAKIDTEV